MELALLVLLVLPALLFAVPLGHAQDPCGQFGDCVSSSASYLRANPDHSLCPGDSFGVPLSITTGQDTTGYPVSWSYDRSVFERAGDTFSVVGNDMGTFSIKASAAFSGSVPVGNTSQPFSSTLTTAQSVTTIQLVLSLHAQVLNITNSRGRVLRNEDGTSDRNDSFCESWGATFLFAAQRTDVKINVTSVATSLRVLDCSAGPLGRTGRFCYAVETNAAYRSQNVTLVAQALLFRPELVILDEPSAGLDPAGMAEFRETIRRLRDKEGITVLLSSHLLHEVEQVSDRVTVIDRSKLVASGTMAQIGSKLGTGGSVRVEVDGPLERVLDAVRKLAFVERADRGFGVLFTEQGRVPFYNRLTPMEYGYFMTKPEEARQEEKGLQEKPSSSQRGP